MKKAKRPNPAPERSQVSPVETAHKVKKPRVDSESGVSQESSLQENRLLDALEVVAVLKNARETDQVKPAIRVCVRMAQSAMRYLLVENLTHIEVNPGPKNPPQNRKGGKDNSTKAATAANGSSQTLKEVRDELHTACQSSPYHFSDRENITEVLWTSLDILKQRFQTLSPRFILTSKLNFKPFWADVKQFLKHKAAESDQARVLVCALDGLYHTAPVTRSSFRSVIEKVIVITVHSSSIRSQSLLSSMNSLVQAIIKLCSEDEESSDAESSDPEAHEVLKYFVRRLFHQFETWHSSIKNISQLNLAREMLPVIVNIVHQVQKVNAELIYIECYHEISKLTELVGPKTSAGQTSSQQSTTAKKSKTAALPTKKTSPTVDWSCLFSCFIWIQVLGMENADSDQIESRYSLAPVRDVLATILLTITRNHLQEGRAAPLVLKTLALLNLLSETTKRFVPMGILLLQCGYQLSVDLEARVQVKPGAKLGQVQSISNILKIRTEDYSVKIREDLFSEYLRIVLDFLKLMAHHPAFPETAHLIILHLKKISKNIKQANLRGHCKAICEAGGKTQRKIEVLRNNKLTINELPSSLFVIKSTDYVTFDIASLK